MAIENPTKYVSVQRLERFKQKLDPRFESIEAATIIPVDLDEMTPSTTFVKNNVLAINGVQYRAKQDTSEFPVVLQVYEGQFVVNMVNGAPAYVVDDYTLSDDWEVWGDAGIPQTLQNMQTDLEESLQELSETAQQIQSDCSTALQEIQSDCSSALQQVQSDCGSALQQVQSDCSSALQEVQASAADMERDQQEFLTEAQATLDDLEDAYLKPVDLGELTPQTTFKKNDVLFINGVGYRAKCNTVHFPVVLQVHESQFVVNMVNGAPAYVVDDYTLSADWEIWGDAGVQQTLANMQADLDDEVADIKSDLDSDVAAISANVTQTLQQIQSGLDADVAAIEQDQAAFITEAQGIVGQSLKLTTRIYNSDRSHSYTVQQLLKAMADLMDKVVVADDAAAE